MLALLTVSAGLLSAPASATPREDAGGRYAAAEHQRIVDFWTPARVAQAVPRDFVLDAATGRASLAEPLATASAASVAGASWNSGGAVKVTTGKVLFAMGTSYYVCSASVVNDGSLTNQRSIVLTAGHCAYDERRKRFATNWTFVPDYDSAPAPLDAQRSFCSQTRLGCWTANALVVSNGYATAGRFNTQAILNDFAFAVVGPGGTNGASQLDVTAGGGQVLPTSSVAMASGTPASLFGYPAASPYNGTDLVYCAGPVGFDPQTANRTYGVTCTMTGGSSGGPWFSGFDVATGTGTLRSVNSYGYKNGTAMYGPVFNAVTDRMFQEATKTVANVTVS
jgi:hypothetical protein